MHWDAAQIDSLSDSINEQLVSVLVSDSFRSWLAEERIKPGDLVVLNNSFLHREGIANKSKSIKYLGVLVESDGQPSRDASVVVSKNRLLGRFKRVPASRAGDYLSRTLRDAVEEELEDLGTIVFAIAGRIGDDLSISVDFPDAAEISKFQYAPAQPELLVILRDTISVNRIDDIDIVWRAIEGGARAAGIANIGQLSQQFQKSFEDLCEQAARPVYIEDVREDSPSILTEIISRLDGQIEKYQDALDVYMGSARNNEAMAEILRIAYNFADGASALITLVVGISDIKPLLCWLTMTAQTELTDRFGALPFSLVGKAKPSLNQYRELIAGARNRAFHDVFAFGRPFQVALTGDAFRDAELRLFREYAKRSRAGLEYKDRDLVELYGSFTRTAERPVPLGFWEANIGVMEAVLEVARSMHRALVIAAPRRHDVNS